jgi:threonine aldolase
MATAEVGDDDYRDDPTVLRLQERAAELLGKEAGLFVPSGVMSNLIAALTHCPDAHRVVALTNSHISWSATSQPRIARLLNLTLIESDERGLPVPAALNEALDATDRDPVGLICFENTHNTVGGAALSPAETAGLIAVAHEHNIPIHLDGARLFNAVVALDVPASVLTEGVDSATFCISKGLGAPIGSVLCGSRDFIERAHDYRKFLGGTMRQVGIVAAAGLYALEHNIDRLAEDHANARWLADQLADIPGLRVTPRYPDTNLIFLEHETIDATTFFDALDNAGIAMNELDGRIRLVTHMDITRDDLIKAVDIIANVSQELSAVSREANA